MTISPPRTEIGAWKRWRLQWPPVNQTSSRERCSSCRFPGNGPSAGGPVRTCTPLALAHAGDKDTILLLLIYLKLIAKQVIPTYIIHSQLLIPHDFISFFCEWVLSNWYHFYNVLMQSGIETTTSCSPGEQADVLIVILNGVKSNKQTNKPLSVPPRTWQRPRWVSRPYCPPRNTRRRAHRCCARCSRSRSSPRIAHTWSSSSPHCGLSRVTTVKNRIFNSQKK